MVKKLSLIILSLMLAQNSLFAAQSIQANKYDLAPDFKLLDLEDKEFLFSSIKGKPAILFFWTTWCPYCQKELKQLDDNHAQLLKDGVELIAIDAQEPAAKVKKFFAGHPLSYRVLLDTDGEVSQAYGVLGVPTYAFINKEGRIVSTSHYFLQKEYKDLILK
ncbi:MAG: TlpA disulfide reductase family protein [Candidatus Omnitrophica bacterium]|nr:TlpA disulfide reductase family protein [Candidatus Omnitrophota bacterium]